MKYIPCGGRTVKSLPILRDLARPLSIKPEIDYVRANRIFIRATTGLRVQIHSPWSVANTEP